MARRKTAVAEQPTDPVHVAEVVTEVLETQAPIVPLASVPDAIAADLRQDMTVTEAIAQATAPAEPVKEGEKAEGKPKPLPALGRPWTQRYQQPVKFAKNSFKDPQGKELIGFRFDLPQGQTKPDDEIIAVMREHKHIKEGKPNGLAPDANVDPESYPTGLSFRDMGPKIGKIWTLPNDEIGRQMADSIDEKLQGLAQKMAEGMAR